jgi:predicted anti-sigma-YlaC factor YlaD
MQSMAMFWTVAALVVLGQSGCSMMKRTTTNIVAGSLARESSGTVFSGDDDPQLVGDAFPFAIKLYESLAASSPKNPRLLLATGRSLCMYAYAYVQLPAEQMSYHELATKENMLERAKHLYLRGRDNILRAISLRHPRFADALNKDDYDLAFRGITVKDTSYLYWAGMAWMGAFTADKADVRLAVDIPRAVALIRKVLDLKDSFGDGAAHEFFISFYGSIPAAMGGEEQKARDHFTRAIQYSHGLKLSPYIALASTVCVKNQNRWEFTALLKTALNIDVNKNPSDRLVNILNQQKARWLLDHSDDFFLTAEGDTIR